MVLQAAVLKLIAGTNRDLFAAVREGQFREDLLARINLWTFLMPGLKNRTEDIEPNLDFELDRFAEKAGRRVTFSKEARETFLNFALSPVASWASNFRDLNAAVARMATLAPGGRISTQVVDEETSRLSRAGHKPETPGHVDELGRFLTTRQLEEIDLFIGHSWRLSSTHASGVVPFQRQEELSSAPLERANPFRMTPIGCGSTSRDSAWNFHKFTR